MTGRTFCSVLGGSDVVRPEASDKPMLGCLAFNPVFQCSKYSGSLAVCISGYSIRKESSLPPSCLHSIFPTLLTRCVSMRLTESLPTLLQNVDSCWEAEDYSNISQGNPQKSTGPVVQTHPNILLVEYPVQYPVHVPNISVKISTSNNPLHIPQKP